MSSKIQLDPHTSHVTTPAERSHDVSHETQEQLFESNLQNDHADLKEFHYKIKYKKEHVHKKEAHLHQRPHHGHQDPEEPEHHLEAYNPLIVECLPEFPPLDEQPERLHLWKVFLDDLHEKRKQKQLQECFLRFENACFDLLKIKVSLGPLVRFLLECIQNFSLPNQSFSGENFLLTPSEALRAFCVFWNYIHDIWEPIAADQKFRVQIFLLYLFQIHLSQKDFFTKDLFLKEFSFWLQHTFLGLTLSESELLFFEAHVFVSHDHHIAFHWRPIAEFF